MEPRSEIREFMRKRVSSWVEIWGIPDYYGAVGLVADVQDVDGEPAMLVMFAGKPSLWITNAQAGNVMFITETLLNPISGEVVYRPGQKEKPAA